jgi:hypothetical protein
MTRAAKCLGIFKLFMSEGVIMFMMDFPGCLDLAFFTLEVNRGKLPEAKAFPLC